MNRVTAIAAAAVTALVFLTGCGGTEPRLSQQEYEAEMQAIARAMNADAAEMRQLASAPSEAAFVELLRAGRDALQDGADRIGDINPPEEIDGPHHDLADALGETADILDGVVGRAEDGDVFEALAALEDAPDVGREIQEAVAAIRTAGYYIGDNDDWG